LFAAIIFRRRCDSAFLRMLSSMTAAGTTLRAACGKASKQSRVFNGAPAPSTPAWRFAVSMRNFGRAFRGHWRGFLFRTAARMSELDADLQNTPGRKSASWWEMLDKGSKTMSGPSASRPGYLWRRAVEGQCTKIRERITPVRITDQGLHDAAVRAFRGDGPQFQSARINTFIPALRVATR